MCCFVANKNPLETVQYGVEGSTTFLECQARSPHMSLKWHVQKENSDRRKEVSTALILNLLWSFFLFIFFKTLNLYWPSVRPRFAQRVACWKQIKDFWSALYSHLTAASTSVRPQRKTSSTLLWNCNWWSFLVAQSTTFWWRQAARLFLSFSPVPGLQVPVSIRTC